MLVVGTAGTADLAVLRATVGAAGTAQLSVLQAGVVSMLGDRWVCPSYWLALCCPRVSGNPAGLSCLVEDQLAGAVDQDQVRALPQPWCVPWGWQGVDSL